MATAIPRITDEFQSLDQVGWYGSAFFLTIAAFQSTWGKIYKYFPLKTSFLIAIAWFEIGSLICGSSTIELARRYSFADLGGSRCAEQHDAHRGQSHRWSWRRRYRVWRLHHHRFRRSSGQERRLHGHPGSHLCRR